MNESSKGKNPHPNILVLLSDQHRWDCVRFNGNDQILTPNFDALAHDGISYTECYSTFPLCTPARYSLLTGLYIHQHQGWGNRSSISKEIPTFARLLRDVGYNTDYIGKLHFTPTYADVGYNQMLLAEQEGPGRFEDDYHRYLQQKGKIDFTDMQDQIPDIRKQASSDYYANFGSEPSHLIEEDYSTTWIGRQAINHIQKWENTTAPQLLVVGFIKPHHPFDPPKPWDSMYSPESLQLLPGWTEDVPPNDYALYHGFFDNKTLTTPIMKRILAHYYGIISHMDEVIGQIILKLKSIGQYDNTLIIYTSDHGEYMGYHHMMLKNNYIYDPVIKVPLIIKYPHQHIPIHQNPNHCDSKLVSIIDITATILTESGVDIPASLHNNIFPLEQAQREIIFAQNLNSYMARTKEFKLIQSENGPSLFFDLTKDPYELHNCIEDPQYTTQIDLMKQQIERWLETGISELSNFHPLESFAKKQGWIYEEQSERKKMENWYRNEYLKENERLRLKK